MLACASMAFAQKPVKIKGFVEGAPKGESSIKISLTKPGSSREYEPGQEVKMKNGKFEYTAQINSIVHAWVQGEDQGIVPCNVLLVPGEQLKLTMRGEEYFYGGSKIYQQCNDADMAITPYNKAYTEYYEYALNKLEKMPQDEQQKMARLMSDTLQTKQTAYFDAMKNYVDAHINEEGAVLYLADHYDFEEIYGKLQEPIKSGRVGRYIQERVAEQAAIVAEQERKAAEEQAKIDAMQGAPAKDFTLKDIKGNDFSLSSLRGKYVVLDFWGSWCGWCIKGIPDMKKYYEKYSGKFEILGIDCNDSEDAWKKAVEKYELPWLHVYNPRSSSVLSDYAIQGFPTKIIIDPQGNVAKVIVGESPEFYEYLDQIMK